MQKPEITIKLTSIFQKVFNDNAIELSDELTANDIDKWDSLNHMLLISEIEEAFAIKFRLKDLNKMRNVGDMITIIESKM